MTQSEDIMNSHVKFEVKYEDCEHISNKIDDVNGHTVENRFLKSEEDLRCNVCSNVFYSTSEIKMESINEISYFSPYYISKSESVKGKYNNINTKNKTRKINIYK